MHVGIDILKQGGRTVTPVPGDHDLWELKFKDTGRLMKASNHHMMVCTTPAALCLDDITATHEAALWTTVAAAREQFQTETGARRILVAINDGEAACQSIPQIHVHILGIDLRSIKTDFSGVVRRDLPAAHTPMTAPAERQTVATLGDAACHIERAGKNAGPLHMVITGNNESDMWALQRETRSWLREQMGAATGFSTFMESGVAIGSPEINIIPRQRDLHVNHTLSNIVRRHFYGVPYCIDEPVRLFMRRHPAMGNAFVALRTAIQPT